jgi:cytoskeletal protein CcmA (bactofilin family)
VEGVIAFMFNRKLDRAVGDTVHISLDSSDTKPTVPRAPAGPSVIAPDLLIIGNVYSQGDVQVEGEIRGDITAARVTVGKSARVAGTLVARDVIVKGTVVGSVRGNRITLHAYSRTEADILHQTLAIEQGAYFEGKSRRADDPIASQPKRLLPIGPAALRVNASAHALPPPLPKSAGRR